MTMRISTLFLCIYTTSWLVHDTCASTIRLGSAEKNNNNADQVNPTQHRKISDKAITRHNAQPAGYTIFVEAPDPNDLGLRFSKITFDDPTIDTSRLPLTAADYPLQMSTALWLSQSACPSVTIPEICPECQGIDFEQLVEDIGGPPTHPSSDPSSPYWNELLQVAVVREQRKNGTDVHSVMPLPDIWEGKDLEAVADAVHDEYPGLHHQALIQYLLQDGATVDNSTVPQHCNREFLRGVVMLAHLNTWAIAMVGPVNFGVKYFVGCARPEEIAKKISDRELDADNGVPQALLNIIQEGSLDDAVDFTAYPEGSPMHPSWPAMHSAASVGSTWLAVVMNLTEEQHCQAKLVDYAVAFARTVAGVHYASDNISGLKLGQKLITDALPGYLEQKYGSDPIKVQEKIDAVAFDWDDFLESDCYTKLMT